MAAACTAALWVLLLAGLCQLSAAARPLMAGNETLPGGNSTARQLWEKRNFHFGPWNKASATFFNTWGQCHCGWAGENCNVPNQYGVAMPKSFYDAYGKHGDWDTWNGDGSPKFFGERGMCGVCLEVKCVGCHSYANGHAGCTNGFNGCRKDGASVIVKVVDLLWEGDANRNTVKYHHHELANWDDCSEKDYCPKGDATDYAKRMDMYGGAFAAIADQVTGIIKVEWRFAPDDAC